MQRTLIHQARARYHPQRVYTLWRAASAEAASETLSREIRERWNAAAESLLEAVLALERTRAHERAIERAPAEMDRIQGPGRSEKSSTGEAFEPAPAGDPPPSPHFEKLFLEEEAADLARGGELRPPVTPHAGIEGRRREPAATTQQPPRRAWGDLLDGEGVPLDPRHAEGSVINPERPAPAAEQDPLTASRPRSRRAHESAADTSRRRGTRSRPREPGKSSVSPRDGGGPVPSGPTVTPLDVGARPSKEIERPRALDEAHGNGPGKSSRQALPVDAAFFEGSRGSPPMTSPPMGNRQASSAARHPEIPSAREGVDGALRGKDRGGETRFPLEQDPASASRTLRDELRAERRRRRALREWRRTEF